MPRSTALASLAAPAGGLRYSVDAERGFTRQMVRGKFAYRDIRGRSIRGAETLARIRSLGIPPAWIDVWICVDERGHLQATGRDARGRKQYRYHSLWRTRRDADKFDHMLEFAAALPAIRRRVATDIALPGMPRPKVLAAIVRLLEATGIRIGNERYAEENDSFGLTTMRNKHVTVAGKRVEFQFRGKSGKFHRIAVDNPRLARIVARCRDLPGQTLFEYLDSAGKPQAIGSSDVNEYLKAAAGIDEVSTKDFRTWNGTVIVARELSRCAGPVGSPQMVAAVRQAAKHLGNTPAICRKSYVHPRMLDPKTWSRGAPVPKGRALRGLRVDEAATLALLSAANRSPRPRRSSSTASPRAVAGPR